VVSPRNAETLLLDLVGQAARQKSVTLFIDVPFLELLRRNAKNRLDVHHWFELLLERGFVREVEEGRYLDCSGPPGSC
jgi:hypothetical protein